MTGLAGYGPIGITTTVALSPERQERLGRRLGEVLREEVQAELDDLRARTAVLEGLLEGSAVSNGGTAALVPPAADGPGCEDRGAAPPADPPEGAPPSEPAAPPPTSPAADDHLPQDRRSRQSRAAQLGLETRRQVQALDADQVRAAVRALNADEIPATAAAITRRLVPNAAAVPTPIGRLIAELEHDRRIVAAGTWKRGTCYQAIGPDVEQPAPERQEVGSGSVTGDLPDSDDDPEPEPIDVGDEMDDDAVDRELGNTAGSQRRSEKQDNILAWLKDNGPAESREIARALGYNDARSIIGALAQLADRGRVGSAYQGTGSTARRQWYAVDLDIAIGGNPGITVRQEGDTGSTLQGRILNVLLQGPRRVPEIVVALNEHQPEDAWMKSTEVAHALALLAREREVEKRHAGLYHRTNI